MARRKSNRGWQPKGFNRDGGNNRTQRGTGTHHSPHTHRTHLDGHNSFNTTHAHDHRHPHGKHLSHTINSCQELFNVWNSDGPVGTGCESGQCGCLTSIQNCENGPALVISYNGVQGNMDYSMGCNNLGQRCNGSTGNYDDIFCSYPDEWVLPGYNYGGHGCCIQTGQGGQ